MESDDMGKECVKFESGQDVYDFFVDNISFLSGSEIEYLDEKVDVYDDNQQKLIYKALIDKFFQKILDNDNEPSPDISFSNSSFLSFRGGIDAIFTKKDGQSFEMSIEKEKSQEAINVVYQLFMDKEKCFKYFTNNYTWADSEFSKLKPGAKANKYITDEILFSLMRSHYFDESPTQVVKAYDETELDVINENRIRLTDHYLQEEYFSEEYDITVEFNMDTSSEEIIKKCLEQMVKKYAENGIELKIETHRISRF